MQLQMFYSNLAYSLFLQLQNFSICNVRYQDPRELFNQQTSIKAVR